MRETDREHRLIEHALSVMDLLRRNRLDLEQFVAGAIQPELPLAPQEEHLAREAIAFMDEMPGGFLIYRAGGDEEILYANRGLLRLLQCEDMEQFREMTGNSFRGLVHPEDLEHVEESIARQIADSHYDLDYVEYRVIRRDGTVRWIEDYGHFTQIPSAGGIFYVFLGDATEKRDRMDLEREQIYQENRRRLEVIEGLSINYESILYVDLDRDAIRPYRLSERTKVQFQEKLQSLSFSWYVADYAAVWVHPEDRELVARETSAERIRERLSQEKTFYINYRVICRGELQYIQLRIVNVGGGDRASQLVMGYRRVDEEVQQEMEQKQTLSQALANANLAVRAKNTFLSNMSHDMRTPLNAISGFTALAKRNLGNREAVENYLSQVETASRQLLELIDKVLETTWLETNEAPAVEAACSLKSIVREICDFLQPQAEEKGIAFTVDLAGVEHDEVFSDQDMIHKLVMYLANNAVTYTKPGGRVSVTALERGELPGERGVYQLVIRDTGVGISKSFLERIFEPFSREQNTTLSGIHGIGLGLTIAKSIVDRMGGALEVKSEPGQGSTFTATLHLRRQLRQAAGPAGEGLPSLGEGRRILLVEDNEINREIETELLQDAGFTIDEAVNGAIAVEKVRASMPGEYDLILMDIQMPVMDGWQAAQAIRALANPALAAIPIVALSANVFQSDINKSLDSGMEAHLTKPIDIPALMKTIERILKRRAGAGGS